MSPEPNPETESKSLPTALSPGELARWFWRQITSMKTALILLFLLALGSIPGSVIPQAQVDSQRTLQWQDQHPRLTPIYEKLGLFNVYGSVWFAAIYILLMISLVGCILPRLGVYLRALRSRPPRAPRNLLRMPQSREFQTELGLGEIADQLRKRRYRVDVHDDSVAAERGYLREAGNLLFHLSILIVLVGFAIGSLWGYRGGVIVVTGEGFANTLSQYDDFQGGRMFAPNSLEPISFTVDDFAVEFITRGRQAGTAEKFRARLTYRTSPQEAARERTISVNHPLNINGTNVFLIGHGYAPNITVRDADGSIAFSGPVVFLPEDPTFRSFGVVKVPDASNPAGTQIGLEGELYPTYGFSQETGPFSAYPDAKAPLISMVLWTGDLGLDSGRPQSVYALDKTHLEKVMKSEKAQFRLDLPLGATRELPDGLGTVTFESVDRFVKLQVSKTPEQWVSLVGMILALLGLLASLFIRPRRIWVRLRQTETGNLAHIAGLDRSSGGNLSAELDDLVAALSQQQGDRA
ncbi:MAG TPA: cytochrome c biogenesis protein ResB [Marmoricola sp.]|nr:cytochrome c biogenesis protein ResB [Marmoricola sp.]